MTRLCSRCRRVRFEPRRDHHRLCPSCWHESERAVHELRVRALVREGIHPAVARTFVAGLGARVVGVTDPEMTNTEGTPND
jgi:hypothetical protein